MAQLPMMKDSANHSYTAPTSSTGCTVVNGGYCTINNNLVIVNMRISTTSTNIDISGFPSYTNVISTNLVPINIQLVDNGTTPYTQYQGFIWLKHNGTISAGSMIANRDYILSCIYII